MVGSKLFPAGALALAGGVGAAYVEYSTYQNNDCATVVSTSIYAGVPTIDGVQATDTCLEYVESTTTSLLQTSLTDGNGVLSLQHVCNITESSAEVNTTETDSTGAGRLTTVWYSTEDCDEETVSYEFAQDVCQASCTGDEPDFGSDEFEDATITFYDSADCSNATDTEVYTVAELYEFYGLEDGSCSPSGEFDFNTVLHCSDDSPVTVYYEDNSCTGDIVGMTYNAGCAPVPSNGTYPGDWFMAECTEGAAAVEDDDAAEAEEDDDVENAGNGAVSSLSLGLSSGVATATIATVLAGFF
eukprot:g11956.t1